MYQIKEQTDQERREMYRAVDKEELIGMLSYWNPIDERWWSYRESQPFVIGKGHSREESIQKLKQIMLSGI